MLADLHGGVALVTRSDPLPFGLRDVTPARVVWSPEGVVVASAGPHVGRVARAVLTKRAESASS